MSWTRLALLVWFCSSLPVSAPGRSQPIAGPTDPKELADILDKLFAAQMPKLRIPGAVFVFVKDGKVLFAKGYGYADLEKKRPVNPEKTLFRVGSVSKLLTATAVMQLAEQGKLNLDEGVNRYLTLFKLPNNFSRPVTTANLLTHTGGFDECYLGMDARTERDIIPLGPYLAKRLPPRVMPPGEFVSYSNYGMALAGYLVEVLSGDLYAQYVEDNILRPLGMHRSSLSAPAHLAPDIAVGYEYRRGTYVPLPFDYTNLGPAGALNATALDMARFMLAHLQGGRYEAARILQQDTAEQMHRQHFTHHPRMPGVTYGFFERFQNGQRLISHEGDLPGFASMLLLQPDKKLGFFVSYNNDQVMLREELVRKFLEHYEPADAKRKTARPGINFPGRLDRFAGSYRWNRYSRRTLEKILALFLEFRVTAAGDGMLTLHYPKAALKPARWARVEAMLFKEVKGEGALAFREAANGRITHMFLDFLGNPVACEKLPWHEGAPFQSSLIGLFVSIFFSAWTVWPVGYVLSRFRRKPPVTPRPAFLARLLAGGVGFWNVVFLVGMSLALFGDMRGGVPGYVYGIPRAAVALLCIPFLTIPLSVGLPIFALLAWKDRYWSVKSRVHYSLITLAALLFIPFLLYWNLLGFRY